MLKNKLYLINELFSGSENGLRSAASALNGNVVEQIKKSWEQAVLSEMPEHTLVRYFSLQLESIVKLSNSIFDFECPERQVENQDFLLNLIDHMQTYYNCYFNQITAAPHAYQYRLLKRLNCQATLLRSRLPESIVMKAKFSEWLDEILVFDSAFIYSFQTLLYFKSLLRKLTNLGLNSPDADNRIVDLLISENFNHLSFFTFLQKWYSPPDDEAMDLTSKLSLLRLRKVAVMSRPEAIGVAYDHAWPSLKIMIGNWLQEEIILTESSISDALKTANFICRKISVELPVTHLAYLTHLFVEESVFGIQPLKVIFKFYTDHFQTKRQTVISPAGFSKAYYSADQQTAARVMALLQKMIFRIKRDFVLVMAAISIAARFYPGIH